MKLKSYIETLRGFLDDVHTLPFPTPVIKLIVLIQTLYKDMNRCDLPKQASAMAYITLLSLVPSLAALFALISVFTPVLGEDSQLMSKVQELILSNLAQGSGDQVTSVLNNFVENLDMGKIGVTSFAGFLFSLIVLLKQIEKALNRVWLVRKERNMFTRFIYFWTFITLGAFIGSLAVGVFSDFDISGFLSFEPSTLVSQKSPLVKGLVGILTGYAFFVSLYKIVPNCKVSFLEASVGALVSSILFQQAGRLFGLYVKYFSKHDSIYGALAALPLFLTWIYICWLIILLGSVISWRVQQGYPKEKADEEIEQGSTPESKLQSLRLQSIVPFFALVGIYKKFLQGEGEGLTGTEIRKTLNLPSAWVVEGLELLEGLGYIAALVQNEKQDASGDYMTRKFFPCYPATTLSVDKVVSDLLVSIATDLKNWHEEIPEAYIELLNKFVSINPENQKSTTVSDVLT